MVMRIGELCPWLATALDELAEAGHERLPLPCWCGCRTLSGLMCSDSSQAKTQGSELPPPNIYPKDELLECGKKQALQIQNYRIPMTQCNNRISKWSPSEVPILIV